MSCPSCNENSNGTLENVPCESCGAPNCATPQPCPEIIPTDCVIYTGDDKECHDDLVYEKNDSLGTVQSKITDYFCEKVFTPSAKVVNLPTQNLTVYGAGVPLSDAISSVVNWAQTLINAIPTGANIISISHSDLKNLETTSSFSPGQWYKIINFKTIYEQPSYIGSASVTNSPELKTDSPVQPIIVFATANNKLASFAFQPDFPEDVLFYELNYSTPVLNQSTLGRIIYRKDDKGNECTWDFRNVKFKRYQDIVSNLYTSVFDTGNNNFIEQTIFGNNYNDCFNNSILINKNFTTPDAPLTGATTVGFDLPNIVFFAKCQNVELIGIHRNITVNANNCINLSNRYRMINAVIYGTNSSDVTNNYFEDVVNLYLEGIGINHNSFENHTHGITIKSYNGIFKNEITYFENSSITCYEFNQNNFGYINAVTANLNNGVMSYNKIENFLSSTLTISFKNNVFIDFSDNLLNGTGSWFGNKGVSFTSNTTAGSCQNNDFGPKFSSNTLDVNFGRKSSTNEWLGNVFLSIASGNAIGAAFYGNNLQRLFKDNVIFSGFKNNDVALELSAITFSNMTGHVYKDYTTKLIKNSANIQRLSYYDQYDAEQTVNITD